MLLLFFFIFLTIWLVCSHKEGRTGSIAGVGNHNYDTPEVQKGRFYRYATMLQISEYRRFKKIIHLYMFVLRAVAGEDTGKEVPPERHYSSIRPHEYEHKVLGNTTQKPHKIQNPAVSIAGEFRHERNYSSSQPT